MKETITQSSRGHRRASGTRLPERIRAKILSRTEETYNRRPPTQLGRAFAEFGIGSIAARSLRRKEGSNAHLAR